MCSFAARASVEPAADAGVAQNSVSMQSLHEIPIHESEEDISGAKKSRSAPNFRYIPRRMSAYRAWRAATRRAIAASFNVGRRQYATDGIRHRAEP